MKIFSSHTSVYPAGSSDTEGAGERMSAQSFQEQSLTIPPRKMEALRNTLNPGRCVDSPQNVWQIENTCP